MPKRILTALEKARAEYIEKARSYLGTHPIGATLTIDDVRDAVPPPPAFDPRVMGAVFNFSDWTPTGYIKSKRKECHNRPICQFTRIS